ncbi:MAG: hypothetical protein DMD67_08840 [Gemmatimonadetes bacterium]|nr:MAG: hypothetical protein DMD67_08840 [Gemmatimonadota bacterium]
MQVLNPIDPGAATGSVKQSFDAVEGRLKRVPNMLRLMANSPAILGAYLQFNEAFEHTRMTPKLRGLITVAVSELNGCEYTLSTALRPLRPSALPARRCGSAVACLPRKWRSCDAPDSTTRKSSR